MRDLLVDLVALPFARLWMKLMRLLLAVTATVSAAAPAVASDEYDCFQGREPELRIKACSELIQRGPDDAIAYHNRAVAYGLAGDIDNAIADYTKVIQCRAGAMRAPMKNRGTGAYASKGELCPCRRGRDQAHELMAIKLRPCRSMATPKAPKAAENLGERSGKPRCPQPKVDSNATMKQRPSSKAGGSWLQSWAQQL
jgi:hypothetical protein